jgi:hypothetical protein
MTPGRRPDSMAAARAELARRAEAEYPGWSIRHGATGWTGTRPASRGGDARTLTSDSLPGLTALIEIARTARCPRHPAPGEPR